MSTDITPIVRSWLQEAPRGATEPVHLYPAIAARVHQTPQHRGFLPPLTGRFQTMFSATKFLVAGAIVALFGGFLLAGLLTQPSDERRAPAGAAAPSVNGDILPGVDLVTEEVEPGVHRVLSDGVRDLDWVASWSPAEAELVVSDGDVWVVREDAIKVGAEGSHVVAAVGKPPSRVVVNDDGSVALIEVGPEPVAWERKGGALQRHTPSGTDVFTSDIPQFEGNSPLVPKMKVVSPDGSVWFSLHALAKTGSDCGGVVHYDALTSTYFLQGRGFCVSAMDTDASGRLWVLGATSHFGAQQAGDGRDRLYVIDGPGTDLDAQAKESDMDQRMSPRATAVAAMSLATALAAATAPAATAQDLQPTMSEFAGRLGCGTPGPSSDAVSWRFPVVVISDERFDGSYVNQLAGYEHGDPDVDGIGAYAALWEITNEDGSWVGDTASFRFPPESYNTFTVKLDGQGAYEGLTAVMEADFTEDCGFDIRGVVVDGELPATPQAVVTTE